MNQFPILVSGKIIDMKVSSWRSTNDFTLITDLDLQFGSGPVAWTNGRNTRFVTAHRADRSAPFTFKIATGP